MRDFFDDSAQPPADSVFQYSIRDALLFLPVDTNRGDLPFNTLLEMQMLEEGRSDDEIIKLSILY